jgi:hypothetical protein
MEGGRVEEAQKEEEDSRWRSGEEKDDRGSTGEWPAVANKDDGCGKIEWRHQLKDRRRLQRHPCSLAYHEHPRRI